MDMYFTYKMFHIYRIYHMYRMYHMYHMPRHDEVTWARRDATR